MASTSTPISKEEIARMAQEALRADRAKAAYAAKHGLDPITLK